MAELDFEICDGKTFRDLCKDIITRSESKKDQLDLLMTDVRGYVKSINDAQVFLPRIKELLEVGIKNDEQIIKLAAVIQKLQSTQIETGNTDGGILTEEEKEQLLKNVVKSDLTNIKKAIDTNDVPQKDPSIPT
jgi:hypothetical protein